MNEHKENKKELWINVTSSYNWRNHHPVGIIRVELEAVRFFLNSNLFDVHFYFYNRPTDEFIELTAKYVADVILGISQDNLCNTPNEYKKIKKPLAHQTVKGKVKMLVLKSVRKLPQATQPIAWVVLSKMRKAYYHAYLVPRYRVLKKISTLKKNGEVLVFQDLPPGSRQKAEALFNKNTISLSLGLDWDFLNIKNHYKVKKKTNCKLVFFCYDVIPVKFPHLTLDDVARHFTHYFVDIAWTADHIFCISKNTERDLKKYFREVGAPVPSTSVVRLGDKVPQTRKDDYEPAIMESFHLDEPFILFVSTIERRKNHETLYRAYRRLIEQGETNLPRLIFVGMKGWGVNDFLEDLKRDPLVKDQITILHGIVDNDLNWLIRNCLFTVYPSLYEGWGLPVAESLSYGKFCIAADNSSIPEVGGDLVEYIDAYDVPKWAERLLFYFKNPQEITKREKLIKAKYRPDTWKSFGLVMQRQLLKIANET